MKFSALNGIVAITGLAALSLSAVAFSSPVHAETDACTLLTPAQVSAAVGFTVGAGTHVTPTFLKTCTWTGPATGGPQTVTLNLQAASFFDGAKRQAGMLSMAGGSMKPASIGDDSFYVVEGTQAMLWVKKGANAFKIAIYKQISADQKEPLELSLAKTALPKL